MVIDVYMFLNVKTPILDDNIRVRYMRTELGSRDGRLALIHREEKRRRQMHTSSAAACAAVGGAV